MWARQVSEPSQLDSVERAIEKLRSAVATMPDLAYDGQGYFVQWIDDTSQVFGQAVGDLSIATAAGPGEHGAGSLESSLWRMYSALVGGRSLRN
jgi:hypothetical protein